MPTRSSSFRFWLCLAAGLLLAAVPALAQPSATGRFEPAQIAVGQTGEYLLELRNAHNPKGAVPIAPGLSMQSAGSQNSVKIVNGDMTSSVTYVYQVSASKPGNYTIPAYTIQSGGTTISLPATTLVVTDQPQAPPGGAGQPLTLTASVERTEVYVGEKFPLDIVLSARDDLRLQGINGFTQTGDAFEQVQVGTQEPVQTQIQQNDHNYLNVTWHTADTALKAGNQTLRFTMPAVVMRLSDMGGGDDMLAQMLGRAGMGFGQQQQITLESKPLNFTVLPLPAEGKPANFTGGIGVFTVDSCTVSTNDLQVGAPITLTLTVSGKGNFDRLEAPTIDTGSLWRAYKPKATFQASDTINYQGTKTFEYVLMPLSETITQVPSPQFNFFNPGTKSYVDLTPAPISVTVKPAPPGQAPIALPAVTTNNAANQAPSLVGPRTEPGAWAGANIVPVFCSPYFLAGQIIPAALLAAIVVVRRRQLRLQSDPAYARRVRARRAALAAVSQARAAASAGHAAEFYAIAQRALQEAASASVEWKHQNAAEALTWDEFNAHLTARQATAELHDAAREIFEAGDALRFGGFTPDPAVLAQAVPRLDSLVQQLLRLA